MQRTRTFGAALAFGAGWALAGCVTRNDDAGTAARHCFRYHPPPQIERIRSSGEGTLIGVDGKLWGEAINGSGLEAVTPPIRFRYRRR